MKKVIVLMSLLAMTSVAFGYTHADYVNSVMAKSPLAYYQMEDASMTNGATCADSSGNGYNGVYDTVSGGSAVYAATGIPVGGQAAGFSPGASGAGQCIYIPDSGTGLMSNTLTVEAWVLGVQGNYSRLLQHNGAYNVTTGYGIGSYNDPGVATVIGGGTTWYTGASTSLLDATYHLIDVTYSFDSGTSTLYENLYMDGAVVWGNTVTGATWTNGSTDLILGAEGNRWYVYNGLHGWLDEVAIYGSVLSASDIATHYQIGENLPEPATIALLGLGLALLRKRS